MELLMARILNACMSPIRTNSKVIFDVNKLVKGNLEIEPISTLELSGPLLWRFLKKIKFLIQLLLR